MTKKTTAFVPLDERAHIEALVPHADRISVRDYVTEVEIGAFQSERDVTQRLKFSVVVEVGPTSGAQTDDVDDILSYDAITEAITEELEAERLNLLETLAERIAMRILREPQPLTVYVRIEKLDRGPGNLGVEIVRRRDVQLDVAQGNAQVPARFILLSPEKLNDAALSALLDGLERSDQPTILCIDGAGDGTLSGPARRIALLALDQGAWQLAARDARCVPVGSRTELDWGLKNGQLSVWTPSKMVLDAVDGPKGAASQELALWLAAQFGQTQVSAIKGHLDAPIQAGVAEKSLEDWS